MAVNNNLPNNNMTNLVALDVKTLNENETAKILSNELANRQRIRHELDLQRWRTMLKNKGFKIIDEDYEAYFESLEKKGVGVIVRGRDSSLKLFKFHYSLKDVGQAALGHIKSNEMRKLTDKKFPKLKTTKASEQKEMPRQFTFGIVLGDRIVKMELPSDLTKTEKGKLMEFIESIPIL